MVEPRPDFVGTTFELPQLPAAFSCDEADTCVQLKLGGNGSHIVLLKRPFTGVGRQETVIFNYRQDVKYLVTLPGYLQLADTQIGTERGIGEGKAAVLLAHIRQ